ncbi:Rieske 2Fe-2S domain-containing protein [Labrys portucalensis]|uniref:Rieske 2Fe-2S domain-containing protein n=1 Tax=Labrys neptuniae TaxID=376174 RepID=A0ABV6ZMT5_9HYPH
MSGDPNLKWVKVATLDELWEGDFLDAKVDGEEVLLLHRRGGRIVCFQGMCPHQEILLADGAIDFEKGTITCSAHEWEFDMEDGRGRNPLGCKLFQYQVKLEGEFIMVGVPTDGRLRRLRHSVEEDA